ncbi:Uncharacterized protein GBIM_08204 [Gryllus bimaculatus]|nr:Uncharacterized protein GBIM_08204 [Gryllus bimaculatus]
MTPASSSACCSDSDRDRDREANGAGGGAGGAEVGVTRSDSARTEASCKLLDENMSLLTRLRAQEHICRKIENELEDIGDKIDDVAKTHEEELDAAAASAAPGSGGAWPGDSGRRPRQFREDGGAASDVRPDARKQTDTLVLPLCGWRGAGAGPVAGAGPDPDLDPDALRHMQRLSSQLLQLNN